MNKIIIAGSRTFTDYEIFRKEVNSYLIEKHHYKNYEIISGMAQGTDMMAVRYAEEFNIKLHKFPADWKKYGKKAGYIRNRQMAEAGTHLLAFWKDNSKGTSLMIGIARELKLPVEIIIINNTQTSIK